MNAPLPPDPYRVLGVESSADAGVIKTAYRKLALKCHPDKFPDPTLKAQKQEEFQRVQQAYEILGDEERKRDYDLEVKAKKLKEELAKRGGPTSTPAQNRYVNVNVRTAEPPAGWAPSKHPPSKSSPYKPYSKEFSQSWEHEIPSRSKAYHEDDRRARRTASYERPKREDSRERRRRAEDEREREKRRDQQEREEEIRKELKRQQKMKERELRDREAREREKDRRSDRKAREERESKLKIDAKKLREKEKTDREMRRKQDVEDKARAKSKPYVEHSAYSEDDEDARRSRAKKPSPKKQSDSPSRDKSSTKQRDRSNPRADPPKYLPAMEAAASYIQQMRAKGSKGSKPLPKQTAEIPIYSAAYPDPNEKWAPSKRRSSGDGKHAKEDPVIFDVPEPNKAHPEVISVSPNSQQAPPRLHKSHTMPTGYVPQAQTTAAPPPRAPLGRSYTMQPEHEFSSRFPPEKPRSTRRQASVDDDDYFDERYAVPRPRIQKYHVSSGEKGGPRVVEAKYKDPYTTAQGVPFSKVKTAPLYGTEDVATSRRFDEDDVATSEYAHLRPSYAEYGRTATAY